MLGPDVVGGSVGTGFFCCILWPVWRPEDCMEIQKRETGVSSGILGYKNWSFNFETYRGNGEERSDIAAGRRWRNEKKEKYGGMCGEK